MSVSVFKVSGRKCKVSQIGRSPAWLSAVIFLTSCVAVYGGNLEHCMDLAADPVFRPGCALTADIDGDGNTELATVEVSIGEDGSKEREGVFRYDLRGEEPFSILLYTEERPGMGIEYLAASDFDKRFGGKEALAVLSNGQSEGLTDEMVTEIHCIRADGQEAEGWPVKFQGIDFRSRFAVTDFDGDGAEELVNVGRIAGSGGFVLMVISSRGEVGVKEVGTETEVILTGLCSADFDTSCPGYEAAVSFYSEEGNETFVQLYNHRGEAVWEDHAVREGAAICVRAAADVNGDGSPELILTGDDSTSHAGQAHGRPYVEVLDADGNSVWLSDMRMEIFGERAFIYPCLSDSTGNGLPDITAVYGSTDEIENELHQVGAMWDGEAGGLKGVFPLNYGTLPPISVRTGQGKSAALIYLGSSFVLTDSSGVVLESWSNVDRAAATEEKPAPRLIRPASVFAWKNEKDGRWEIFLLGKSYKEDRLSSLWKLETEIKFIDSEWPTAFHDEKLSCRYTDAQRFAERVKVHDPVWRFEPGEEGQEMMNMHVDVSDPSSLISRVVFYLADETGLEFSLNAAGTERGHRYQLKSRAALPAEGVYRLRVRIFDRSGSVIVREARKKLTLGCGVFSVPVLEKTVFYPGDELKIDTRVVNRLASDDYCLITAIQWDGRWRFAPHWSAEPVIKPVRIGKNAERLKRELKINIPGQLNDVYRLSLWSAVFDKEMKTMLGRPYRQQFSIVSSFKQGRTPGSY